jgi:predicted Zn-dependent protease
MVTVLLISGAISGQQTQTSSFSALKSRAEKAAQENRLDQAVRLYNQALALRPRWADGWWSLGTLEYDRDHYAGAAYAFQRLLQLQPSNGTAHAMLGLCQFELGKDELARKNLLAAEQFGVIRDDQLRKVALYHLGVLQLRAHRFGDAQETLQQLAKEQVRTHELIVALGQAALLINPRGPRANNVDPTVIERAGDAEALAATKDFDRAKQIYSEMTSHFPDFPNLHFAFGRMLLQAHEADEAIGEFHRELQRDPKHVNSMLEIASVRYQSDSEDGLKYAEAAARLSPTTPFAHYLVGILRLDTGNAAGAIPELEIAQKAFPNQSKIYFSLGNAYARVGRKADAATARAEFKRLDGQTNGQNASNVYGEQVTPLSERQLQDRNGGQPLR